MDNYRTTVKRLYLDFTRKLPRQTHLCESVSTKLDEKVYKKAERENYKAYWNKIIEDIQNSDEVLEGEPERFITSIKSNNFDYTEWHKKLWEDKTIEEIHALAVEFENQPTPPQSGRGMVVLPRYWTQV